MRLYSLRVSQAVRRTRLSLLRRVAAGACAGALAVACASQSAEPRRYAEIAFSNRVSVPARGPAMLVSLRLTNHSDASVRVRSVSPPAEDSLRVDYLGYADCSRGCPGGEIDNADAYSDVVRSVKGLGSFQIPPERETTAAPVYLMFRATAVGGLPGAQECLVAGPTRLRLADGTTVAVTFQGSWAMALIGLGRNRSACDASAG